MTPQQQDAEARRLRRRSEEEWHGERPWPVGALPRGIEREEQMFHHARPSFALPLVRHEAKLIAIGIIGAIVLAMLLLPIAIKTLGALTAIVMTLFVAVYIVFATIPMWVAALVDDYEDHRAELTTE